MLTAIIVINALLLSACRTPVDPTPALRPAGRTPTATLELANSLPAPTTDATGADAFDLPSPTPSVAAEQVAAAAEPSPAPTETATIYPVSWTVHAHTLSTGETGYMIDDEAELARLKARFWEFYRYFSYQDGLPALAQVKRDLEVMAIDGDAQSGRQAFLPRIAATHASGEYARIGNPDTYTWRPDLFWFSAAGTEARLVAELPAGVPAEMRSIETGAVLRTFELPAVLYQIVLHYDERDGSWRWASTGTEDPARFPLLEAEGA